MDFFAALPWQCWILSVLLGVTWIALWWRSRRARLWFAGLTPPAAVVVVLLGLVNIGAKSGDLASQCSGVRNSCGSSGAPRWEQSLALIPDSALLPVLNGVCGLLVAVILTIITFVVV